MQKFYRTNFNRCIFIDKENHISESFLDLCKKQKKLTLHTSFFYPPSIETPFAEIQRYDNFLDRFTFDIPKENSESFYKDILNAIIDAMKIAIRRMSGQKCFFSCSSGTDSRIIMAIMAKLRDEEGCNFDDVLFYSWTPSEYPAFLKLTKRFGWKNIYLMDASGVNPYKIGYETPCVEGFYPYTSQIQFWGEIDPSEYILFGGADGEICQKTYKQWLFDETYWCERGEPLYKYSKIFKDVYFPYLQKEVLQVMMSIPPQFKNIPDPRLDRDKLRTDLCDMLGALEGIPMLDTLYPLNLGIDDRKRMLDLYEKSQFRKDYELRLNYQNLFDDYLSQESKIWTFAVTTYQQLVGLGIEGIGGDD